MNRHWIRKFVVGSSTGVLVLASLAIMLFAFPGIWFNGPVLSALLPRILPRVGVGLNWSSLEAETHATATRSRSFRLQLKNAELTQLPLQGKIESLELETTWVWWALPPRLDSVEKLHAISSQLKIVSQPSERQEISAEPSSVIPDLHLSRYLPPFLTRLEIGDVDVEAKSFEISDAMQPVRASLRSESRADQRAIRLDASSAGISDAKELSAAAVLPLSNERRLGLSNAQLDGHFVWGELGLFRAKIALRDCEQKFTCGKLEVSLTPPPRRGTPGIEAHALVLAIVREDTGRLDISGSFARLFPWLPEVAAESPCLVEFDLRTKDELQTKLGCTLRADLKIPPVPGLTRLRLPTDTLLKIDGSARLQRLSGAPRLSGDLALETQPLLRPLLESKVRSQSQFRAELKDLSRIGLDGFHHETLLFVDARVPQIDVAERMLHDTRWAIPAPFNNLDGALSLKLEAQWRDWSTTAPFKLRTELESSEQALQTHTGGEFEFRLRPSVLAKIKADVTLDRVRLSAPRLALNEIPRFFPDSQIRSAGGVDSAKLGTGVFAYDIAVRTPPDQPLRVDTNLISKPLGFDIQARLRSDAPLELAIHTRPFDFEKLRQVTHVEKLNLDLGAQDRMPRLDVRAGIPKGDYKIYITVNGTTDKAKVAVSSDPPAPQDEVWALLLYGEPMSALDIDQQANAQSSKQAISRGAFGILSLWALASTPIERIDYDPVTKRASARVHLAEGTSLEVGTSEAEGRSLGLRKRLGRGWAVNGQVSSQTQGDSSKSAGEAGASLEWSARY